MTVDCVGDCCVNKRNFVEGFRWMGRNFVMEKSEICETKTESQNFAPKDSENLDLLDRYVEWRHVPRHKILNLCVMHFTRFCFTSFSRLFSSFFFHAHLSFMHPAPKTTKARGRESVWMCRAYRVFPYHTTMSWRRWRGFGSCCM